MSRMCLHAFFWSLCSQSIYDSQMVKNQLKRNYSFTWSFQNNLAKTNCKSDMLLSYMQFFWEFLFKIKSKLVSPMAWSFWTDPSPSPAVSPASPRSHSCVSVCGNICSVREHHGEIPSVRAHTVHPLSECSHSTFPFPVRVSCYLLSEILLAHWPPSACSQPRLRWAPLSLAEILGWYWMRPLPNLWSSPNALELPASEILFRVTCGPSHVPTSICDFWLVT